MLDRKRCKDQKRWLDWDIYVKQESEREHVRVIESMWEWERGWAWDIADKITARESDIDARVRKWLTVNKGEWESVCETEREREKERKREETLSWASKHGDNNCSKKVLSVCLFCFSVHRRKCQHDKKINCSNLFFFIASDKQITPKLTRSVENKLSVKSQFF